MRTNAHLTKGKGPRDAVSHGRRNFEAIFSSSWISVADNDPDARVHLTFLDSAGRGWFIEEGPHGPAVSG